MGANSAGQLGDGTNIASSTAVQVATDVVAIETARRELIALVDSQPEVDPIEFIVRPDLLLIDRVPHHAADVDRDFRINLIELKRVIELYNT